MTLMITFIYIISNSYIGPTPDTPPWSDPRYRLDMVRTEVGPYTNLLKRVVELLEVKNTDKILEAGCVDLVLPFSVDTKEYA